MKYTEFILNEGSYASNDDMSSLREARKDMPDDLYNALQNVVEFNNLGMDQQGELVSLILKKLKQFGVR